MLMNKIIKDPSEFGKVLVILGGHSSEREISLKSGRAVVSALKFLGVNIYEWDPAVTSLHEILKFKFDRAFIVLHGRGGEDGKIQAILEFLGIPYTGSNVTSSAIAMNKIISKKIFQANDIPTPKAKIIYSLNDAIQSSLDLNFPMVLKPISEGSSIGMTIVSSIKDLDSATELALSFNGVALAEECIIGDEVTVSILNGEALPSILINTPNIFYDYHAKYQSLDTQYICPSTKDSNLEKVYSEIALNAFRAIGCNGWGRVDFMIKDNEQPKVLEINTVPGMTEKSLVPMAAENYGLNFNDLCWQILETSIKID